MKPRHIAILGTLLIATILVWCMVVVVLLPFSPADFIPEPVAPHLSDPPEVILSTPIPFQYEEAFSSSFSLNDSQVSPGGNYLAVADSDGVAVYDAHNLEGLWFATGQSRLFADHIAYSPDESLLATMIYPNDIVLWDTTDGKPVHRLSGFGGSITSIEFHPDGDRIAVGIPGGMVVVWNLEDQQRELRLGKRITYGDGAVGTMLVAWSPDGNLLAGGGGDNPFRIWEADTGNLVSEIPDNRFFAIAWSPDGTYLATAERDFVYLRNTQTDQVTMLLNWEYSERIRRNGYALCWSPDGSMLASGSWDGTIFVWKIPSGEIAAQLSLNDHDVDSLGWGHNGDWLFSSSYNEVIVWDFTTGEPVAWLVK